VRDGSTAVIAGLIEDQVNRTRRQAPLLGDLPLIGWLFGSRSSNFDKSNLVVLVTPHIVKEGVDLDRVTEYKIDEYQNSFTDLLFEGNVFQRVRRKQDMRRNSQPTRDRLEETPSGARVRSFGRGDVGRR